MRYLFLLIVIVASIGVFVAFVNPRFRQISALRATVASYTQELQTANQLKASREQLIATYNSIQKSDLDNLSTLLPDNVNNIRLVIQINALALKDNLSTVKNVNYNAAASDSATPAEAGAPQGPYGTFQMSFETTGPYKNFLAFIADMEKNLRLIDITSATFAPVTEASSVDNQDYKVTLNTYWLRQ
jgi:Tfp pilus assembly protein PilO